MSTDKSGKGSRKGKGKRGKAKPEGPMSEVAEVPDVVSPTEPVEVEAPELVAEPLTVAFGETTVGEPVEETPVVFPAETQAVILLDPMTSVADSVSHEVAGQFAAIPEEPDPPSYAPILTGLGIAVFAWGFLAAPFIILVGMLIFATGMTIWIKELTHEP